MAGAVSACGQGPHSGLGRVAPQPHAHMAGLRRGEEGEGILREIPLVCDHRPAVAADFGVRAIGQVVGNHPAQAEFRLQIAAEADRGNQRSRADIAVDRLLQRGVVAHFGQVFSGCDKAGQRHALGQRRVHNGLELGGDIRLRRKVQLKGGLILRHAVIHRQTQVVFRNRHLARGQQLVFGYLRAGENLLRQPESVVERRVPQSLVLHDAGSLQRPHPLRLVDLHLNQALFNAVGIHRNAEGGLGLGVKCVELGHHGDLVFRRNGLPGGGQVFRPLVAEQPVNGVVLPVRGKGHAQPFRLRQKSQNIVFPNRHFLSPLNKAGLPWALCGR